MSTKFTQSGLYTKFTQYSGVLFAKKFRFIISSFVQLLLFYYFRDYLYNILFLLLFIFVTFVIQVLTLWSSEVKSKLWIYLFGIFVNVSLVMFYNVYPQLKPSLKVIYSLIFGIFNYSFLITSNVFLVSFERGRKIPLIRASLTLNSILNLFVLFFLYVSSIKLWPNIFLQVISIFISTLIISWYYFFVNNIDIERNKKYFVESLLVSILIIQTYLVLIFKQLNFFYIALILTTASYTLNDYMKNYLKYSLKKQIIISYFIMNLIVFCVAILSNTFLN